jgi:hypothetical protein
MAGFVNKSIKKRYQVLHLDAWNIAVFRRVIVAVNRPAAHLWLGNSRPMYPNLVLFFTEAPVWLNGLHHGALLAMNQQKKRLT